jgi:hypothetical protein
LSFITDNKDFIVITLGVIGFILALRTFRFNLQQRKIENTFKILDFMRKHIGEEQIDSFIAAFHANNPLSGVAEYEFVYPDGKKEHLDHFFSEGGSGNGDIHNIIEIFNLVAINLNKNELKEELIWYEYGQIMSKCYQWTHYLETKGPGHKYYAEVLERSESDTWFEKLKMKKYLKQYIDPKMSFSYHFNRYMKKASKINQRNATKYYTYIE